MSQLRNMDFEISMLRFAMDFGELLRMSSRFSDMSDSIIHVPQVHLSHNERPYVGENLASIRFGAEC